MDRNSQNPKLTANQKTALIGLGFFVVGIFVYTNLVQKPREIRTSEAAGQGDCNNDGRVNILDYQLLSNTFGRLPGQQGYNANCDFNADSRVNILDYQILSNNFGRTDVPTGGVTITAGPTADTPSTPPTGECSATNVRCVPSEYSSISSAISAAANGDQVVVSAGTYSGFNVNKRVIISAATYNTTDPKQNNVQINGQVSITGGSSWAWDQGPVIRGFRIRGSDPVTMEESPATIEYNYITGTGGDNVSFEGGGGIVRGNIIEDPGDDNIDLDDQDKNVLIENNQILNASEECIEARQQNVSISGRADVIIRNNRFENCPSDGFQIMDYNNFTNRRYIIERNVFIDSGEGAIAIMPSDKTEETLEGAAMPEPMYVINNTFINNNAGIAGGANAVVVNNIFSGSRSFDLKNVSGSSQIKYNLFSSTPKLQGSNNLDQATTFVGNPLLNSNYFLQSGSPAIDKGVSQLTHSYTQGSQTFNDTVVNISQYNGSAPDLGWKEF